MSLKTTMDTLPFISVVIPAYNEEKYLSFCLQALQRQTYPKNKFDIIVSNNNSTDKTAKIARQYEVTIVHEAKQGNTFALEKGLANSTGEIIACTDADSIPDANWLEEIARIYIDPNVVGLTGYARIDLENQVVRNIMERMYSFFLLASFAIGIPNFSGFNMSFRKKSYTKVGGINTKLQMSSDVDLGKRLKKVGKVVFAPRVKVVTSARRWNHGVFGTLREYITGYIYVNLLQKSPSVKQKVIR